MAAKVAFLCTNNTAEYEACILELRAAIDFKVTELEVFGALYTHYLPNSGGVEGEGLKTPSIPSAHRETF